MVRTVVMTVSADRPSYLRDTLESWRNVRSLDDWAFRFHIEPSPRRQMCVDLIYGWIIDTKHADTSLIYNGSRLGVLRNPWSAFDAAFEEGSGFVVLVEEDIIVSADVLDYLTSALTRFDSDPSVLAVCASNFGDGTDRSRTYLAPDFCPLVWGTWWDRWSGIIRDTWDHDYSTGKSDGSEAGWDWNIRRRLIPQRSLVCVHPEVSRALHIGEYGAHMLPENFASSQARNFQK